MEQLKRKIKTRYVRLILSVIIVMMVHCTAGLAIAAELDWPRDIEVAEGTITLYQPQLESFKGDKLSARAAISFTQKGQTEPVFGAVWLDARVSTNRDTRVVTLLDVDVPQVKFPDVPIDKAEKLKIILEKEIPKWNPTISLDRLLAMLDLAEKEKRADENLKATPPKVIFVPHPAVLIVLDGQPQLSQVENSSLMRVVNTPFLITLDPTTGKYYYTVDSKWLSAASVTGPWVAEKSIPASVVALAVEEDVLSKEPSTEPIPQVIVSTEPAELIMTKGQPKYTPIDGTDLLYVSNTVSELFMHIGTQLHFVLLSGRWYASTKLTGPWSYVAADKLPVSFAKIPPDSAKGYVLAHIPGTQQATEAILETYIPQTAAVNRSEAKVVVIYDGSPKFVKIEGADMYYAVNTSYSVVRYGSMYYCCNEAVWFVAANPLGPWEPCVAVPQVIYTIPPSCPVYHVKYVYVYSYTPTVVYVGYTPGYVGCYAYGGVVVYGTGYVYRGWYGTVYYPRPVTYGYSVTYSTHTGGWSVRVGGGVGRIARSALRYEYWDHRLDDRWDHRHDHYDRAVARPADPRGAADPRGRADPRGAADPRGRADPRGAADPRGRADPRGAADPRGRADPRGVADPRGGRSNNVYADRNGSVHRKTDQGWQQRDRSGWSSSRSSRSSLDRDHTARQRGTDRTNNFNRSRGSGGTRGGSSRGRRR
ncbi:MAG: hypothetical protein ACYTBJ_05980 [Planctomycetota bacterium]|jgi:hypothetical protein